MNNIKILRVRYENVSLFKDGILNMNLTAMDKVTDKAQAYHLNSSIYTQKLLAVIGINASGKTTTLKLLNFALGIVLDNANLNAKRLGAKDLLEDGTRVIVDFFCAGKYFQWEALIGKGGAGRKLEDTLYFKEEFLRSKDQKTVKTKKEMFDFSQVRNVTTVQRTKLSEDTLSVLKDSDSIVIRATRNNDTVLRQMMSLTNINMLATSGTTPGVILQAFDSNIETLTSNVEAENISYKIKFKNKSKEITINNPLELVNVISSGTIKGQNIMYFIREVLQNGGYLFVDELENHLNKELLRMITDIFKSDEINKNGACLIFSTHYTEILDFMDRKDNIYIVRRQRAADNAIELLNYSQEFPRKSNDVKKSEVILSNFIKGTAPSYEYIQALKKNLCNEVW